jgi:hypothetical protein
MFSQHVMAGVMDAMSVLAHCGAVQRHDEIGDLLKLYGGTVREKDRGSWLLRADETSVKAVLPVFSRG